MLYFLNPWDSRISNMTFPCCSEVIHWFTEAFVFWSISRVGHELVMAFNATKIILSGPGSLCTSRQISSLGYYATLLYSSPFLVLGWRRGWVSHGQQPALLLEHWWCCPRVDCPAAQSDLFYKNTSVSFPHTLVYQRCVEKYQFTQILHRVVMCKGDRTKL